MNRLQRQTFAVQSIICVINLDPEASFTHKKLHTATAVPLPRGGGRCRIISKTGMAKDRIAKGVHFPGEG